MRRVVLDTETTGLEYAGHDRIIEIAAVELDGTKLTGQFWHTYLNPRVRIQPGAFAVHKITDQFLEDKPTFDEAAEDLLDFLGTAEIIGHNYLGFDKHFIDKEFKLVGKLPPDNPIVDTLLIARAQRPGKKNSLDALLKAFKIQNTREGVHGALVDAELNARVYAHLMQTTGAVALDFTTPESEEVEVEYPETRVVQATEEEINLHAAMCAKLGITAWQQHPRPTK